MKKLILLLFIPLFSFSQESERIFLKNFINSKGVNLSIEIPENFKRMYFNPTPQNYDWVATYSDKKIGVSINISIMDNILGEVTETFWRSEMEKNNNNGQWQKQNPYLTLLEWKFMQINDFLIYQELYLMDQPNWPKSKPSEAGYRWTILEGDKIINMSAHSESLSIHKSADKIYNKILYSIKID